MSTFERKRDWLFNDLVTLDVPPVFTPGPNRHFCMDIVNMSLEEVTSLPLGLHTVVFMQEPFEVTVPSRNIIFTWFFWQLFKAYPGAYPRPKALFNEEFMNVGSGRKLSTAVYWNVYYGVEDPEDKGIWELNKSIYQTVNDTYNWSVSNLGEYVGTISLKDQYDFINHPRILAAYDECLRTINHDDGAIQKVYDVAYDVLMKGEGLEDNAYSRGVRTGIMNERAVTQIGVMRGMIRELDGTIVRHPITSNLGNGYNSLFDSYCESRTAARAEISTTGPLRTSEYNTRKIQLSAGRLLGHTKGDCGSEIYDKVFVEKHNLGVMVGKYRRRDDQEIEMIQEGDTFLIDTEVHYRTPNNCLNANPQYPCATCIGHNARVLDLEENLGHRLTIDPCAAISNAMMKVKHLEVNSIPTSLVINHPASDFFKPSQKNEWLIGLHTRKSIHKMNIRFSAQEAKNLSYVNGDYDIKQMDISKITSLKTIRLDLYRSEKDTKPQTISLKTNTGKVTSSFTTAFLLYIKQKGFELVKTDYVVNVSDWKSGDPIIQTPRQSSDIEEYLKSLRDFLTSAGKKKRNGPVTAIGHCTTTSQATAALLDLYRPSKGPMVDQRMTLNMSQIEIFSLAAKVSDTSELDYRLPKGGMPYELVNLLKVLDNGSYSAKEAYQGHRTRLMDPKAYVMPAPDPHVMDYIIGRPDSA